jgi:hypothetical protein
MDVNDNDPYDCEPIKYRQKQRKKQYDDFVEDEDMMEEGK